MHKRSRYSNIFDTRVYFGLTEFINLLNIFFVMTDLNL